MVLIILWHTNVGIMKDNLKSINTIPFIICLTLLLVNDFYLKTDYHNWFTGKLSDFCGLFVFASFWIALIPHRRRAIHLATALLFIYWKSPVSQPFIDAFSQNLYSIDRVVDVTDLMALSVLLITWYHKPNHYSKININPAPLALLTVFSFCATSMPESTQVFDQPQYLLFKSGVTTFEGSLYPNQWEIHPQDSLVIIEIKEIRIDHPPSLNDDYHKVQLLKDIDLRFLRELRNRYSSQIPLTEYRKLREALVVNEIISVRLPLDSMTDQLTFNNGRLHGQFKRLQEDDQVRIEGKYKHGIEDSIWTYYTCENKILLKKYFDYGELTKTEVYENSVVVSENEFQTRDETISYKYVQVTLLGLLILAILTMLIINFKKNRDKDPVKLHGLAKLGLSMLLPIPILILARLFSSFIPISYNAGFFEKLYDLFLVFVLIPPLGALIFYVIKLRNWMDLVYYILLFAIGIVFIHELIFLRSIV